MASSWLREEPARTTGSPSKGRPARSRRRMMLLEPDGTPLIVTNFGFHRFSGDNSPAGRLRQIPGLHASQPQSGSDFRGGTDSRPKLVERLRAAIDPKTGLLVIYNQANSSRSPRKRRPIPTTDERKVVEREKFPATVTTGGGVILVACRAEWRSSVVRRNYIGAKANDHCRRRRLVPSMPLPPRWEMTFAVLVDNRRLWLIDSATGKQSLPTSPGNGTSRLSRSAHG